MRQVSASSLFPFSFVFCYIIFSLQAKTADGKMNNKSFFWKTLSQGAATFVHSFFHSFVFFRRVRLLTACLPFFGSSSLLTASFAPSSALFSGDDRFNAPYILHNQVDKAADFVRDDAEQVERLWRLSEELVGEIF